MAHLQDAKLVGDVKSNFENSEVSPKMKALLRVAGMVQRRGKDVSSEAVESAKNEGASDVHVHDTVLIAAMFCMFNRYVDGLAAKGDGGICEEGSHDRRERIRGNACAVRGFK